MKPGTFWLQGEYKYPHNAKTNPLFEAKINTRIPFVAIEPGFYCQGEEAEEVIDQIYEIWIRHRNITPMQAIMKFKDLYL